MKANSFNLPKRSSIAYFLEYLFELISEALVQDPSSTCMDTPIHKLIQETEFLTFLKGVQFEDTKALELYLEQRWESFLQSLKEDAQLILEFDPAANSFEEVILSYPGFYAISIYRFSHLLYQFQIPILPRLISEYAHGQTGIDIHPGAKIGVPFFIDHGTGVVIGQTAIIGKRVKIYQGVTLGALMVRKKDADKKRHPTIQDDVVIYANSTILGGATVIGHNSIIGGNTWLTESCEPYSLVYHKSSNLVRQQYPADEPLNWVI